MPPAEYPLPSTNAANPDPLISYKQLDKYQVGYSNYDDGGIETALQHGGTGIQRWYFLYDGLFAVQAAILDAHVETAKLPEGGGPSAYAFNMRDPDSAILYSGVRYESYERPVHEQKDLQRRLVILVKHP